MEEPQLNRERVQEWATLHALGVLSGDDLRAFEQLLAHADDATRELIRSTEELAASIGASREARQSLPAHLKAKLMEQVRARAKSGKRAPEAQFVTILKSEGSWTDLPVPGARCKALFSTGPGGYKVTLYELAAGSCFPAHHHEGAEDCYILSGDLRLQGAMLHAGDFQHAEPGSDHEESFTETGCQVLVIASLGAEV